MGGSVDAKTALRMIVFFLTRNFILHANKKKAAAVHLKMERGPWFKYVIVSYRVTFQ